MEVVVLSFIVAIVIGVIQYSLHKRKEERYLDRSNSTLFKEKGLSFETPRSSEELFTLLREYAGTQNYNFEQSQNQKKAILSNRMGTWTLVIEISDYGVNRTLTAAISGSEKHDSNLHKTLFYQIKELCI